MAVFDLTEMDDVFPGVGQDTSGDDVIAALAGNDSVVAGAGDDILDGGLGLDTLRGGSGNDTLFGGELVYGGDGNDEVGAADGSVIFAELGNDTIATSGGLNTTIWAGLGDDTVRIEVMQSETAGLNVVHGQAGTDLLDIGIYPDDGPTAGPGIADIRLSLTDGIWRVNLDGERPLVADGFETLNWFSTSTSLLVQSGDGDDRIGFQAMTATIQAGGGDDVVVVDRFLAGMTHAIDGGVGDDRLVMYFDDATRPVLVDARGESPVVSVGGVSLGTISGIENYTIQGSDKGDRILLGAGDDVVNLSGVGGGGKDVIGGGAGDDTIYGGGSADSVTGGVGNDAVFGGAGDDTITGGVGRDYLAGGVGKDVFDFNATGDTGRFLLPARADRIAFFELIADAESAAFRDRIDLSDIDARAAEAGDQSFSYIGSAAFSAEGQVRYTQAATLTLIEVNTAGTDGAEMRFYISSLDGSLLGTEDFIL